MPPTLPVIPGAVEAEEQPAVDEVTFAKFANASERRKGLTDRFLCECFRLDGVSWCRVHNELPLTLFLVLPRAKLK